MFGLFKKKNREKNQPKPLLDLLGNPLAVGDKVNALRYELGDCVVIEKDGHLHYKSLNDGKEVIYVRMIDAITGHQKVNKLLDK